MIVIGLTGGIGSGKSTIAAMLAELGAIVIDADQVAREVVEPGTPAFGKIVKAFGPEILLSNGRLNRQVLGTIVFNDEVKRKKLNQITHPAIKKEIDERLKRLSINLPRVVVVIEASLLIEAGMVSMVDEVWVTVVEPEIQAKRIMNRDGLDYEATLARIESQMTSEERLPYGDVILLTGENLEEVRNQVAEHWKRLQEVLT